MKLILSLIQHKEILKLQHRELKLGLLLKVKWLSSHLFKDLMNFRRMGSLIVAKPEHSMTAWSKLIGMVDQIHSKVTVPLKQAAR